MDSAQAIQAAQVVSITTSLISAGYSYGFSQNAVPQLYSHAPSFSTPVFKGVFLDGANTIVPLALVSTSASAFLAYALPAQRSLWLVAGVAALLSAPWTRIVMYPGIQRLIHISENAKEQEKAEQTLEHRQLLKAWVAQNYARATFFLISGATGLALSLLRN